MMVVLAYAATWIQVVPVWGKWLAWPVYWWCQGVVCTGIWVIAHECGHQGFSDWAWVNNAVGYVLHSFLLVPYFSWKITHAKHHKANAHMNKDQVFIPKVRSDYRVLKGTETAEHHHDDEPLLDRPPILDLYYITRMLFIGWPAYLLFNASGQKFRTWTSHFRPAAPIFDAKHYVSVVVSDIGMGIMIAALVYAGWVVGSLTVIKFYVVPYLVVNMWLVLITYLQHTDYRVPHFREGEWTFLLGALSTVDRDYGILNHFFHHIGDTHVAHHLFSTMPHYNAKEATEAIKNRIGKYYHYDKTNPFVSVWRTFRSCRFVEEKGDVLFYKH
ncbi:Delta(12)-fatty-acid desaturase [Borealophlyctis nickersoniae]|nr:Delta(12)-fatty-acid desaturase [Borealophlyctis nickersoniae]